MTEAEWLSCADPQPMLEFLRGKASERKLRLYSVACCRFIWHLLRDEASKTAVEKAEQCADQSLTAEQLKQAYFAASPDVLPGLRLYTHTAAVVAQYAAWTGQDSAWYAAERAGFLSYRYIDDPDTNRLSFSLAALCVFGNPFRPVAVDPSWLTSDVLALASQMYESRDFSPMPILADALMDADCSHEDILNHCRQPGEHVRGCWVIDLLLGKE